MSKHGSAVHGSFSDSYQGYHDDGSYILVGDETDASVLRTGHDNRVIAIARKLKTVSFADLMRLHKPAVLSGDREALAFLREVKEDEWEITPELPRNAMPADAQEHLSTIDRLRETGGCPHTKAAVEVITASINAMGRVAGETVAATPVI